VLIYFGHVGFAHEEAIIPTSKQKPDPCFASQWRHRTRDQLRIQVSESLQGRPTTKVMNLSASLISRLER
jgi:hypothetical protein